jgi:hypothetical protein
LRHACASGVRCGFVIHREARAYAPRGRKLDRHPTPPGLDPAMARNGTDASIFPATNDGVRSPPAKPLDTDRRGVGWRGCSKPAPADVTAERGVPRTLRPMTWREVRSPRKLRLLPRGSCSPLNPFGCL